MRIFKIKARHCCLRKWKKREREWKTKLAGIIWRTRFSKICFAGKMEKIHSWEKLDSSIPESGFASQWKSIETSFGLEERERKRERVVSCPAACQNAVTRGSFNAVSFYLQFLSIR